MEMLNSVCRICLEDKSDIYSIFDLEQRYLPAIIFNISGVKIVRKKEPGAKICSNCKKAVLIAESIIFRCQETEEFLQDQQKFLNLKTESENNDNLTIHDASNEHLVNTSAETPTEEISTLESSSTNKTQPSNSLQCDICKLITKTVKSLVQHRAKKHNIDDPNIFNCPTCSERFPRKLMLYRHIETVHKVHPEEKKYLCFKCGKAYISEKNLLEHQKESHEPRRFKCVEPNCRQSFTRAFTLRRHFLSAHDTKSRYYCDICNLNFRIYDQWRYHNNAVHKNIKRKQNKDDKLTK